MKNRSYLGLVAGALMLVAAGPPATKDAKPGKDAKPDEETLRVVGSRVQPSCVWLVIIDPISSATNVQMVSEGTGVLVDAKRKLILTAVNVMADQENIVVFFPAMNKGTIETDRRFYLSEHLQKKKLAIAGKLVAIDTKRDLALVELESLPNNIPEVPLTAKGPKAGEAVYSLTNPSSGKLWTQTGRMVKQVGRSSLGYANPKGSFRVDALTIATDVPTKSGESGGPLLNSKGELVGLVRGVREFNMPKTPAPAPMPGKTKEQKPAGYFIDVSEIKVFINNKDKFKPRPAKQAPRAGTGTKPGPMVGTATKPMVGTDTKPGPMTGTGTKPGPMVGTGTKPGPTPGPKTRPVIAKPKPEPTEVNPLDEVEMTEKRATAKFKLAQNLADNGKERAAREYCQDIIKKFPQTKAATDARKLLEKLDQAKP